MSRVRRKQDFCIQCENKDADQLRGNQRLCFPYIDTTIALHSKSKISRLGIFCGCTARFLSDLVGNLEYRFSHIKAHMIEKTQNEGNYDGKPVIWNKDQKDSDQPTQLNRLARDKYFYSEIRVITLFRH